jgi:hypothetical protein
MKRISVSLPNGLHHRFRQEASRARLSMSGLVRSRLASTASDPRKALSNVDPLLKVAGICQGPLLSDLIDEELYGALKN